MKWFLVLSVMFGFAAACRASDEEDSIPCKITAMARETCERDARDQRRNKLLRAPIDTFCKGVRETERRYCPNSSSSSSRSSSGAGSAEK